MRRRRAEGASLAMAPRAVEGGHQAAAPSLAFAQLGVAVASAAGVARLAQFASVRRP